MPGENNMPKPIHPLFPIYNEVAENREAAHSDHLPILAKIPLTEDENAPTLNIISLNILGDVVSLEGRQHCSGIHPAGHTEDENEQNARYSRLAAGLTNAIVNHKVSAIVLQESAREKQSSEGDDPAAEKKHIIEKHLKHALENILGAEKASKWVIRAHRSGVVTCYDSEQLQFQENTETFRGLNRIFSHTFIEKNTNQTVILNNTWGDYCDFSCDQEVRYQGILVPENAEHDNAIRIVIGDTNSRAAPIDNVQRNIVTGAIPAYFINQHYSDITDTDGNKLEQLGDHPDVAFFSRNGRITQVKHDILDFNSGEIFEDQSKIKDMSYINKYRTVMCLDDYYRNTPLIDDKTIFEYENFLRQVNNDNEIFIRMSANTMNQKAIAIRFLQKSPFGQKLNERLSKENLSGYTQELFDGNRQYRTIYVPLEDIPHLVKHLNELVVEQNEAANPQIIKKEKSSDKSNSFSSKLGLGLLITTGVLALLSAIDAIALNFIPNILMPIMTSMPFIGALAGVVGLVLVGGMVFGGMKFAEWYLDRKASEGYSKLKDDPSASAAASSFQERGEPHSGDDELGAGQSNGKGAGAPPEIEVVHESGDESKKREPEEEELKVVRGSPISPKRRGSFSGASGSAPAADGDDSASRPRAGSF